MLRNVKGEKALYSCRNQGFDRKIVKNATMNAISG